MDIRKQFGTDATKETEGVWVDLGGGARILLARVGNARYQQLVRREMGKVRVAQRGGFLSDDQTEKILLDALVETVVLNWEGFEEDGQPVPYSKDAARRLLQIKDFKEFVVGTASDLALFKSAETAEAAKN